MKQKDFGFQATNIALPNGESAIELRVDGIVIGKAVKTDGGHILLGREKSVKTITDCARQCIDIEISKKQNEIKKLRHMMQVVLKSNHENF